MNRNTLDKEKIISLYLQNQEKGKYWVADQLGLNRSSVSTIINKYCSNSLELDKELENKILEAIKLFPYTGTKSKITNYTNTSNHSLEQVIHKTSNQNIINHFQTPKISSHKLTDQDIQDILDGSKKGIGNDQMGIIKNIDGVCIRNIRKKFLTPEEYATYHSIERFYSGDYNSYYNSRGDKFLSTWEEKIADYLYESDVKYFTNVRISYKGKNYSPDIYLPKSRTFIEIFGMSNVGVYKDRMNEKIKFYTENNIKCLFLFEEDFLLDKKPIQKYKKSIDYFLPQIENSIFNKHIKSIYIQHKI
jgi:hypothetical protein